MRAMKGRAAGILLAALVASAGPLEKSKPLAPPALGLAAELEKDLPAETERKLMGQLRATGVSVFALPVAWPAAEPSPGKFNVTSVIRAARLLRQSGASVHLDLPLVVGREKTVPADLAQVPFDDSKLSIRLGQLLDALTPALLDSSTLSLGYEADVYFYDKQEELKAYRLLLDGAVTFLQKKVPDLAVGVTTLAPTESPAPVVAAMIHQRSPVLFYVYAPFERNRPFVHRPPSAIEEDWKQLLRVARGRPIAFPEVSYSSSPQNESSPEKQAEFVRRLRRLVAGTDGRSLLFARYVSWRDPKPDPEESSNNSEVRRGAAFFAHRGLQTWKGEAKPAWREWLKAGR
jgi:hypothetical protein